MSEAESSGTFGIQASGETPKDSSHVVETRMDDTPDPNSNETSARMYADKYKSVEDLEQGYQELQSKLSQEKPSTSDMNLDALLEAAGVSNDSVVQNWINDGKLTDEQYAGFQRIGISQDIVNQFLKGQVAIARNGEYAAEQVVAKAHDMAGGPEQWDSLMQWASGNYSEEQQAALNARLEDPTKFEGAIKEMLWDYKMESGKAFTQPLVQGQAAPNTSSGFDNVNEFVSAMAKVRTQGYADEAFKRRLANTPAHIIHGVNH